MSDLLVVRPDDRGRASLSGDWEFFPGEHAAGELDGLTADTIRVPGLWEAQGWLDLDGPAWYRRRFAVDAADIDGWWTLRFGAVMDTAEVHLNGAPVGAHDLPFTPFEFDVTPMLRAGENELVVRVVDHPLDSPEHIRSPHGKQGWANHVFPSRPSLYMTYGGIWQGVTLRRHGPVRIDDVFVNADPRDFKVDVTLQNVSSAPRDVRLAVRTLGVLREERVRIAPGATVIHSFEIGETHAAMWSPDDPVLQAALVDVIGDDGRGDARDVRFGLRTVRVEGTRLLINDEPYRMKSALVQGFRADDLYAEGDRAAIVEEVEAAKAMGFNTLRLHIKAFDPLYLDVCDELGMLLHCDLPVAEPIAHAELGADTEVAARCVAAIEEQIRRDRNHPSVILWSAMNELTLDGIEWRPSDGYEAFARTLSEAVMRCDPTRPFIENDWVEPEPERVFTAPVLTAHWYGRLHMDYLAKLERACNKWIGIDKPLYVTEFGDWGLPHMPEVADPPFWDTRAVYAASLAATQWPGTFARFLTETQRYQGLSDRLQGEVFRRHDHIGGYCVTELTDVPGELNGLLDLYRAPKPIAVAEVTRLNQTVLPMLHLESLVARSGAPLRARAFIANDGPALEDVELHVRFGVTDPKDAIVLSVGDIAAYAVTAHSGPRLEAPAGPGNHDLLLELRAGGRVVATNRYPMHVVARRRIAATVQALGSDDSLEQALAELGARVGEDGPLVIGEAALTEKSGEVARSTLEHGGTVVLLAQGPRNAAYYPVPVVIAPVLTEWGSSVFHFTTDSGALPSLPRHNLLVHEDPTMQPRYVLTKFGDETFVDDPVVVAFKPVPDALAGTVVGSHRVGRGRLIVCQYRVVHGALEGDAAARAVMSDLLTWACSPRPPLVRVDAASPDGRAWRRYTWDAS